MDKITFVVNANHSKRVEVLSQAYSKLAEIRLLLEIYIVPKFEGEGAGDSQNIKLAIEKFHELYKFCLMNGIFFSDESKIMKALGEIMGHINAMRNTMSAGNYSSWEKQARIFTNGVTPIIAEIRVEVREELKLDIKRAV